MVTPGDPGTYPPAKTPRVGDEQAVNSLTAVDKSPKSVAFPSVEIVTKSILFFPIAGEAALEPAKIPRALAAGEPAKLLNLSAVVPFGSVKKF